MMHIKEGADRKVAITVFNILRNIPAYAFLMRQTGSTFEKTENNLKTKDMCFGIYDDDKCIGATWVDGIEIAVMVLPEYKRRWATRKVIIDFFNAFFKKNLIALVSPSDVESEIFMKKVGFIPSGNCMYLDKNTYENKWSKAS